MYGTEYMKPPPRLLFLRLVAAKGMYLIYYLLPTTYYYILYLVCTGGDGHPQLGGEWKTRVFGARTTLGTE